MATYKHLRSSTANKRPTTSIADGQIAINTNTASPGLFFKDSAGTGIVKVGPVHVGTTAPNVSPAAGGSSGNYTGEQWLDTSVSPNQMKVWNGSAWVGIVADELPVSKLQDGAARQLIQTDAAGTGVEWTSNIDLPGTLDVTGAATLDSTLSVAGNVSLGATATLTFEGATDDAFETTLSVTDPTADRSIVLPNVSGTVVTTGDSGTVTSAMIADGTIVNGDVNASAAIAGTKISPDFGGQTVTTTGVVSIAAGTAGAPSLAITGDTNTGLHSPGADQLAISTGGTGRVFVASDGKVGIGASSPATTLEVQNSTSPIIRVGDGTRHVQVWGGSTTQNQAIGTATAASFNINVNSSPVATFDASGRLLVGTSASTGAYYDSAGDWQGRFQVARSDQNAVASFSIWNSTASTYTNYGGVQLHLSACKSGTVGSHTSGALSSGDTIGSITFDASDGTNFRNSARIEAVVDGGVSTGDVPGRLVFSTTADGASSPTERARITNDGYFKASNNATYNTASPDYHQFNQNGDSQWTLGVFNRHGSDPYGLRVTYTAASPNNTVSHFLYCDDGGGTIRANIRSNGGLANYSANNANLSDRNAKKDISPAADTWDCIKEWEIVNYRYKDQPDDADLNLGVIAQQVAESCPEVITVFQEATEDEPEKLGIKEQQMYWMAIKALQEAQVRIEQLEARLTALESA